ncbi:MAG: hypothetical protein HKN70_13840 [Gammaproteobacteria bacterium]|nr:hypothetical protein [Gammaproteobacteria bacterium]
MASSENFDPGRIKSQDNQLYGIQISLKKDDTFSNLLGDDWHTTRWYASRAERDAAMHSIGSRHIFSRLGDEPTLIYTKIDQTAPAGPQIGPQTES